MLLGIHVGEGAQLKTQATGGHPMKVHVYRRRPEQMTAWLDDAGFRGELHKTLSSAESVLGGIILARCRADTP
ncbi:hypothetical protein ACFWR9_06170 [Streptomyces sp. NPDC058534]|uniref:hypothetical protein n=1 Tax=Streptomyces sp. NPDC058534 TaxID=3346541 RepID=UPI0036611847